MSTDKRPIGLDEGWSTMQVGQFHLNSRGRARSTLPSDLPPHRPASTSSSGSWRERRRSSSTPNSTWVFTRRFKFDSRSSSSRLHLTCVDLRTIYNMCTQKPPHDYSENLYNKYREAFVHYITEQVCARAVGDSHGEPGQCHADRHPSSHADLSLIPMHATSHVSPTVTAKSPCMPCIAQAMSA